MVSARLTVCSLAEKKRKNRGKGKDVEEEGGEG